MITQLHQQMLPNLTFTIRVIAILCVYFPTRFFLPSLPGITDYALEDRIAGMRRGVFEITTSVGRSVSLDLGRGQKGETKVDDNATANRCVRVRSCTSTTTGYAQVGLYPTCEGLSVYPMMRMMPRSGGRNLGYSYH